MKARASFFLTTSLLPGKQMPTTCNNYIVYVPTRTLLFGVALLTATTSTSKSSVDSKSSPFRMSRNNPGGRTQEKYSIIWSTSTKLAFNCQTSRIIRSTWLNSLSSTTRNWSPWDTRPIYSWIQSLPMCSDWTSRSVTFMTTLGSK